MSIKLAAGEAAFESCCLVYIRCYQEAGSKVGIYNTAAWIPQQPVHQSQEQVWARNLTRCTYIVNILPYATASY